jgi:hypothetical protein
MLTDEQCRKIAEMAEGNHIWLNAFRCVNPSKETCEEVGRTILDWLNNKDCLMPARASDDELAKLTPKLYLSVNKS